VIKQIGLAIVLVTLAGAASAKDKDKCKDVLWSSEYCHHHLKAPEIDPTSAMAALTLMAGGLAVLRGRRTRKTKA
jgi:hypothetical protein